MSCESCKNILEVDDAEPDCFEGECKIPPLDETGQRIMEMRSKLISLHDLVDPGTILRMYGATKEDIELLAFIENEMKSLEKDNMDGKNG